MKRNVAIVLVVLVAAVAAWSAYAYAQGGGPLKRLVAACQPACGPSAQPRENAPACHDGADCRAAECPKFRDADGDGQCDTAGDCHAHGSSVCCNGANHCGGRPVPGHRCGGHRDQSRQSRP